MFENIPDFYPTPVRLIDKMLAGIKFDEISSILEPSAGKGDLADKVSDRLRYSRNSFNKKEKWDIDTVEIDANLQHILKGKSYRVVHDDFLTFHTYKKYDLIVANPPFSQGDRHLLRMIDLLQGGGKIVCLLNAESIRNPCTNARKDLLDRLDKYTADIEFIDNAFVDAEHRTGVEVALVRLDIPKTTGSCIILDELKKEERYTSNHEFKFDSMISADFLKGIVEQYNFEIRAGLKLMAEYEALKAQAFQDISLFMFSDKKDDSDLGIHNSFIKQVRIKYWKALFSSDKFMGLFTSNLRYEFMNKVDEMCEYDFSLYNIRAIKLQINRHMIKSMEDTIIALFDEFSHKHYWHPETGNNIHYYNGWASNKAWKINKKVIICLNGYHDLQYSWGGFKPTYYKTVDKLTDVEKVLNYLDGGMTQDISIQDVLQKAEKEGVTKKIRLKYFTVTFYKKGTCHIEFSNDMLLHKFNVFGSQRKGWLPPVYGKAGYKDMNQEERAVINDFEGEESYARVIKNKDYYISDMSGLLMLA